MLDYINEEILAENVDAETFMREYADLHAEWVNGVVIKMSPVSDVHNLLTQFLITFFTLYLAKTKEGVMRHEPFVMKLSETLKREPDLFIVTTANKGKLKPTLLDGAADLVIEVVSPESIDRDRGTKLREYETAGVNEYWVIDPVHKENIFYTLSDEGRFNPRPLDENGFYTSQVLPRLRLPADIFLKRPVPDGEDALNLVMEILKS